MPSIEKKNHEHLVSIPKYAIANASSQYSAIVKNCIVFLSPHDANELQGSFYVLRRKSWKLSHVIYLKLTQFLLWCLLFQVE